MFTLKKDIPQLYQWDSNVKLIVEDDRINQVQFSQRFSQTAVCVKVENKECFIPNEFLQSYYDIFAYACIVDNDGQVCEFSDMFSVFARPKPDNYVYTPTEILTLKHIEDELNKKFEALAKEIEDDMETAVRTRPQELTEEEKSQARKNIGAISSEEDRGAYYVTITEDENGYISDRTFDDISYALNNNLFPYAKYDLNVYPLISSSDGTLTFGGVLGKSFTEIKIMPDNSVSINNHNYSPDWEAQEYDDGFIKNRTHGKIIYKCDTEEKVPTSMSGARELTDAQETYLQSIGANTKSSKELSFVLPGYDVSYDRMSNEYDYDNYEPPNESNTKIQIAIQDSSGIMTAMPSFTVSEIKANDILYGWSFNFTDGGFAENYLKCIVMLLKHVPYNGYIRKGIWLPNYTGSPKKGYACKIEYTCIKKLENMYIPDLGNSLQSDWNENDEASPAYVKNRTHYVEYVETGSDYQGFQNAGASMTMCFKINGIMYFNITASSSSYYYTYTVGEYTITINNMSYSVSITPTADFSFVKIITKKIDVSYLPDTNENILNGNALGSIRTVGSAPENDSYSLGQYDFSIGLNTRAYGECCFASGKSTKASGYCAFAEGVNTEATGNGSHASGFGTISSGEYSYTCGVDTKASGKYSFAGGQGTEAKGWGSHTEGLHTIATGNYQHIQGKYNIGDSISAYIVGNGNDIERSNAHTLDWSGNAWYSGDVYVGSSSGKNKDDGSVKLAREDNVVLVKSQNLTMDQQSQVLANIGGLSKNQGTENSGKFLGIGADGIVIPTNSPTNAFSDDGSGNISVNGASANAKRFLNSLTVPGLDYEYVNPINSGTYASPYGVYISSGTVIDYVVGLTQVGFYTAYVNRRVTDIPDAAKAANSSLRGFVCVSQIDNTASGGSTKCYAYIVLIDQNSNFYIQYIQSSTGGGWKRMYPYETAESALMEKLDKNQGTANSGKFLGIGANGVVVPTDVGGGSGWITLFNGTIATEEAVNSMSADLLKSCEGMNEFLVWYTNTKNTVETPGNDNSEVIIGKANYGYGRFGDLTLENEKIVHMFLTDNITYSYVIDTRGNSMQYNTGTGTGGWSSNKTSPDYNKVKIACFNGTYIGTISLKIYGR